MRLAQLKRILRMRRLRLRGPTGAQDEFNLAAIAQNLRKLARLIQATQMAWTPNSTQSNDSLRAADQVKATSQGHAWSDFSNNIGQQATFAADRQILHSACALVIDPMLSFNERGYQTDHRR